MLRFIVKILIVIAAFILLVCAIFGFISKDITFLEGIGLVSTMIACTVVILNFFPWDRKVEWKGIHLTYDADNNPIISIERFVLWPDWFGRGFGRWNYQGKMTDHFFTPEGKSIGASIECSARILQLASGGYLIEIKDPNKGEYQKKTYFPYSNTNEIFGKIYGPAYLDNKPEDRKQLEGEEYILQKSRFELHPTKIQDFLDEFEKLKSKLDRRLNDVKTTPRTSLSKLYLP